MTMIRQTLLLFLISLLSASSFSVPKRSPSLGHGVRALHAVTKSDQEWQSTLTPEAYNVLRQQGTEAPFSSPLNNLDSNDEGILVCSGCGAPLFALDQKFDSKTGWPSFVAPITSSAIAYTVDFEIIVPRTECTCANCGGHLGHVFDDGPAPTGLRYCMNGVAMEYDNSTTTSAESPSEAGRLPLAAVLPSVALNLGVASLFLVSWANHDHQAGGGVVGLILESYPLPIAAFYGYSAVKSLLKAKL